MLGYTELPEASWGDNTSWFYPELSVVDQAKAKPS